MKVSLRLFQPAHLLVVGFRLWANQSNTTRRFHHWYSQLVFGSQRWLAIHLHLSPVAILRPLHAREVESIGETFPAADRKDKPEPGLAPLSLNKRASFRHHSM